MKTFKKENTPIPHQGRSIPLETIKGPLDLEIGCGTGEHPLLRSQQSTHHLIAIEKTRTKFLKFENHLKKRGHPKNLWPIHTNAVWWLSHYGTKDMFQNIFILYPNPYPKNAQSHLRWINRPFFNHLLLLLKKGGTLEFRTNKQFYYEELKQKSQNFQNLAIKQDKIISSPPETLFEKKYLENKEICYLIQFIKEE